MAVHDVRSGKEDISFNCSFHKHMHEIEWKFLVYINYTVDVFLHKIPMSQDTNEDESRLLIRQFA